MVGRPSRRYGICLEANLEGCEVSGRVWKPFRREKRVRRGRVALCECREWPGDSHGGQEGLERSSRRDSRDREAFSEGRKSRAVQVALPVGQEKSRGPPGEPSGVRSPSQMAGCGRRALLEGREKSTGPPRGLEGVGRLSGWAGNGREAFLEAGRLGRGQEALPEYRRG